MLKSELIKDLVDSLIRFGDSDATVSVFGNSGEVSLKVTRASTGCYHNPTIECDLEETYPQTNKFKDAILEIDDWC